MNEEQDKEFSIKMQEIKYRRRSLCMGDDAKNGIYKLSMPDDSTIADLMHVLMKGGNGNDWPIPQTSGDGWDIHSNIGKIAFISADKECIEYYIVDENTVLSSSGIRWVFGEYAGADTDMQIIARGFEH